MKESTDIAADFATQEEVLCVAKVDLERTVASLLSGASEEVRDNSNNIMFALDARSVVFLKLDLKKIAVVPRNSDCSESLAKVSLMWNLVV